MEQLVMIGIRASIVLLVFCLGLRARFDERFYLLRRPRLIARSLFSMDIVMPLVAIGVAVAFDLPHAVKIALVALAISPVPPILPRKEIAAGGSSQYAFGLQVSVVLISILFVPAAVLLISRAFGTAVYVPPETIAGIVFSTILLPLAAGVLVRRVAPHIAERFEGPLSKLATIVLVVAFVPVLVKSWPAIASLLGSGAILAIVLVSLVGHAVGHMLGGPDETHRTVLALSTASRHPMVAMTIVKLGFPGEQTAPAAVLLAFLVNAIVSSAYLAWRRRHEKETVLGAPAPA